MTFHLRWMTSFKLMALIYHLCIEGSQIYTHNPGLSSQLHSHVTQLPVRELCLNILSALQIQHQFSSVQFSSVAQSCMTLRPHEPQHARPPCPSPTPGVYSNSCPLSRWCHPAISSSVIPFSSCLQSLPASGSFPMSQLFAWGGQNIEVSASASVLPMNTQDWSPLGWTGWISNSTYS